MCVELRRQDRADRAGVDRLVGVPAHARVDGADVQAGRAADAAERLAADLVGEHVGPAVVEQHEVELARAVALAHAGPERGVRVHPLAGRRARQQLEEDLHVAPGRHELLDAHHRDEQLGQRGAHAPVALGLEDADGAGLGHREVRPGDPHPRVEELPPQVRAAPPRRAPRARRPGPGMSSSRANSSRISARFLWIAGTRMCDCTSSPSWMISSARSVSTARTPASASASFSLISSVAIDLTFTTSSTSAARRDRADDPVGLGGVTRPVHLPAGRSSRAPPAVSSSAVEIGERGVLRRSPAARSSSQSGSSPTTAARFARIVRVAFARLRRSCHRAAPPPRRTEAHDASTSARCMVRTPARCRDSAPPIRMRHELSVAHTTSAPVSRIARTLSVSIADETSAFLMAKVPPKPQHPSRPGGRRIDAAHRGNRRSGRSPRWSSWSE